MDIPKIRIVAEKAVAQLDRSSNNVSLQTIVISAIDKVNANEDTTDEDRKIISEQPNGVHAQVILSMFANGDLDLNANGIMAQYNILHEHKYTNFYHLAINLISEYIDIRSLKRNTIITERISMDCYNLAQAKIYPSNPSSPKVFKDEKIAKSTKNFPQLVIAHIKMEKFIKGSKTISFQDLVSLVMTINAIGPS